MKKKPGCIHIAQAVLLMTVNGGAAGFVDTHSNGFIALLVWSCVTGYLLGEAQYRGWV